MKNIKDIVNESKSSFVKNIDDGSPMKNFENKIMKFLKSRTFEYMDGRSSKKWICSGKSDMNNTLGLAYTSSGSFAGLFVNNVELFMDKDHKFSIAGFTMDNQGNTYAWCSNMNNSEDDIYICIG